MSGFKWAVTDHARVVETDTHKAVEWYGKTRRVRFRYGRPHGWPQLMFGFGDELKIPNATVWVGRMNGFYLRTRRLHVSCLCLGLKRPTWTWRRFPAA